MQLIDLLDAAEKKLEVAPTTADSVAALRCAAHKQTNAVRSARALRRSASLRRRAGADGPRMLPPESPNSEPYALKIPRFSTLKPLKPLVSQP